MKECDVPSTRITAQPSVNPGWLACRESARCRHANPRRVSGRPEARRTFALDRDRRPVSMVLPTLFGMFEIRRTTASP